MSCKIIKNIKGIQSVSIFLDSFKAKRFYHLKLNEPIEFINMNTNYSIIISDNYENLTKSKYIKNNKLAIFTIPKETTLTVNIIKSKKLYYKFIN